MRLLQYRKKQERFMSAKSAGRGFLQICTSFIGIRPDMSSLDRLWEAVKMLESIKLYSSIVPFYQDLLGYSPEQTSLQQISESQWNKFATQRGLNPNSFGIYLPRNQTAIIKDDNPLSLFHEYFGHGLYCEQSLIGRKLVELEKKLLEEEKKEFSKGKFTLEDIKKFRQPNQTFQE